MPEARASREGRKESRTERRAHASGSQGEAVVKKNTASRSIEAAAPLKAGREGCNALGPHSRAAAATRNKKNRTQAPMMAKKENRGTSGSPPPRKAEERAHSERDTGEQQGREIEATGPKNTVF